MTPVSDPEPDTPEFRYNKSQMSTRSLIERCNGLLKMRFRCLLKHRVLHYAPEACSRIINACTILHNMCVKHNIPEPQPEEEDELLDYGMYINDNVNEINEENVRVNPELTAGRRYRRLLIRNYFT